MHRCTSHTVFTWFTLRQIGVCPRSLTKNVEAQKVGPEYYKFGYGVADNVLDQGSAWFRYRRISNAQEEGSTMGTEVAFPWGVAL